MSDELSEIYNFLPISESIATAGRPTEEQLAWVQEAGYEVVINLAMPTQPNALLNEAEIVQELGMEYISIPVVFNQPTHENLVQFMDALDVHAGRKLFVHCMANHRVASFIYLYRILRLGMAPAEAETQLLAVWQPNAVWDEFIRTELAG